MDLRVDYPLLYYFLFPTFYLSIFFLLVFFIEKNGLRVESVMGSWSCEACKWVGGWVGGLVSRM